MSNLTIRGRIFLLVSILIGSMVFMLIFGYVRYNHLMVESVEGEKATALEIELSRSAQVEFKTQVQEWKNILLRGSDANAYTKYVDGFKSSQEKTLESMNKLKEQLGKTPEESKSVLSKVDDFMKSYAQLNSDYAAAMEVYRTAVPAEAYIIADKAMKGKDRDASEHIDAIVAEVKNKAQEADKLQESQARDIEIQIIVILLIVFSVSIAIAVAMIRSITLSITESVATIRDGAMQITSASDQVASSSASLAQGASQQASSVEEVSAVIEEASANITQNTNNATQADILAKNSNDSAKAGYEKGEQLSHSMHAITESAAKISGIIKTIDQIAFQTNLLALNAAVEAARAGEHGLGFAVVADEVRNLAQRAASAAKETSEIIEEVVGQIKEGNEIAHATHTAFQDIVEQSKKVSDLIGEIAIAGREQADGITQLTQAIGQVDQVTQQVAANSEESAAAAEELNSQATSMMETVRVLAAMAGMKSETPVHAPKPMQLKQLPSGNSYHA